MAREYRQNELWLVELEELEWYAKQVDREAIQQEAVARARMEGCTIVAIMVQPDALFPMCGYEKKHRVYEYVILGHFEQPFKVNTVYTCELEADDWWKATDKAKTALLNKARDHLNAQGLHVPGRYSIVVRQPDGKMREIERGRV